MVTYYTSKKLLISTKWKIKNYNLTILWDSFSLFELCIFSNRGSDSSGTEASISSFDTSFFSPPTSPLQVTGTELESTSTLSDISVPLLWVPSVEFSVTGLLICELNDPSVVMELESALEQGSESSSFRFVSSLPFGFIDQALPDRLPSICISRAVISTRRLFNSFLWISVACFRSWTFRSEIV